jgi:hypothetical protein
LQVRFSQPVFLQNGLVLKAFQLFNWHDMYRAVISGKSLGKSAVKIRIAQFKKGYNAQHCVAKKAAGRPLPERENNLFNFIF